MSLHDAEATGFEEYLEAKFALDERSLNASVRGALLEELQGRGHLTALDLGSGTGAMVRRLLRWFPGTDLSVTALDRNAELLATARLHIRNELQRAHFVINEHASGLCAESIGRTVSVEFACCEIGEFDRPAASYDLVTTHAVADLLVPVALCRRIERWLRPGGYWYASVNYDGGTFLFPSCDESDFERELLECYDRSMEARRIDGQPTGGARSGSRLVSALAASSWTTIAYGTSDWNLTPLRGVYRDCDSACLSAMLAFIHGEGEQGGLDPVHLARWTALRARQLVRGELGMIVHQLDLLARLV